MTTRDNNFWQEARESVERAELTRVPRVANWLRPDGLQAPTRLRAPGIDPKDVEPAAFFRVDLRRIARCVNQGRKNGDAIRPFDYLRSSEDPDARKVVGAYLSVPESYRRLLPACKTKAVLLPSLQNLERRALPEYSGNNNVGIEDRLEMTVSEQMRSDAGS